MGLWSKAFRVAALFMVMFVAVEVATCDYWPDSSCNSSQSSQDKGAPGGSDNCICCCARAAVMPVVTIAVQATAIWIDRDEPVRHPVLTPLNIEHPPQLA
ncbi:MAG: hypothetical protein JST28_03390 [Acidobacteria bacterium]|nr:hypothetical protein [Acidobacteriota bacterium]